MRMMRSGANPCKDWWRWSNPSGFASRWQPSGHPVNGVPQNRVNDALQDGGRISLTL
jgi:hypothetical protein